jgi:zinc finger protein 830
VLYQVCTSSHPTSIQADEVVKQWDAHLLTKQHRASVTREKQSQSTNKSKRPAEDTGSSSKRPRTEEVVKSSILPAGFFSGGGPTIVPDDDDEEEEEEAQVQPQVKPAEAGPSTIKPPTTTTTSTTPVNQTGDEELDSFLASLAEPEPEEPEPTPTPTAATQKNIKKSSYREIIPGQASYEAAPVRNIPKDQEPGVEEEVQETEAEKRARLAREEREEIMDRLEEEERAQ